MNIALIGIDESGKGDPFGPLVVAAVYLDDQKLRAAQELGVKDSKKLTPQDVRRLAGALRHLLAPSHYHVLTLLPDDYNDRYDRTGNLNTLLAQLHAEAAQPVWEATGASTLSDQFVGDPSALEAAFAQRGLPHPRQMVRAESQSLAVAAASILATDAFRTSLSELGRASPLQASLPAGASDVRALKDAARRIMDVGGQEALRRVAKLHFATFKDLRTPSQRTSTAVPLPKIASTGGALVALDVAPYVLEPMQGGYRFRFHDGAHLNWWPTPRGTLNVTGPSTAPSVAPLRRIAARGTFSSAPDTDARLAELRALIDAEVPRTMKRVPSVLSVTWTSRAEGQAVRYSFSDGAVLNYYPSTGRLVLQGAPTTLTREALEHLGPTFLSGREELDMTLRTLFPQTAEHVPVSIERTPLAVAAERWQDFWPTAREVRVAASPGAPGQRELLSDWAAMLELDEQGPYRHLLAHAPTGLGKTAAALVPALAWVAQLPERRRVYYLVGRVAQHANPLAELRGGLAAQFEMRTGTPLKVIDLVSRDETCLHPRAQPLAEVCKNSGGQASFARLPSFIASWSEVKAHLEPGTCPYHTQRALATRAHVVVCDYGWLFSQTSQTERTRLLGVSAHDSILIVDEAHNLPHRVRSELDVDVSFDEAQRSFRRFPFEVETGLNTAVSFVRTVNPEEGCAPSDVLPLMGGEAGVGDLLRVVMEAREHPNVPSDAERLLNLLLLPDDQVVLYSTEGQDGEQRFIARRIDALEVLQRGYGLVHASLSMSGTLAASGDDDRELLYQAPLFGLPRDTTKVRKYASPFALRNQRWTFVTDTLGTYHARARHLPAYQRHITDVARAAAGGVTAVFFSSYAFLNSILQALPPEEAALVVAENSGEDRTDTADVERRLRALVGREGRATLFAVYQGQLAEGANFTDNLIRAVVCVSLPVEYPGLFHRRLQVFYEHQLGEIASKNRVDVGVKAREYARDRLTLSQVLQACGRGIRRASDRCVFVLLDQRYAQYGWRQFLDPAPFQVTRPTDVVRSFLNEPMSRPSGDWDPAVLAACRKDA